MPMRHCPKVSEKKIILLYSIRSFIADSQPKLQQSLLISESEFVKVSSSSSSESTANEHNSQMHTPSPRYTRSASHPNEPLHNRYSDYDNRPIKPLDKSMFLTKLNEYPIENHPSNDEINNSRQSKRTSTHSTYNANHYSPKPTNSRPVTSNVMQVNMRTKSTPKNVPLRMKNSAFFLHE